MSDKKRKSANQGPKGDSKRSKYFSTNSHASMPLGARGFLVSCVNGREAQATREALNVLQEYYEAACPKSQAEDGENKKDISSLLAEEVADLKDPEQRLFAPAKTNISGLLFIRMQASAEGPGPADLATRIAEDVQRTRQSKTRCCMRFTPVDDVTHAKVEDIQAAAAKIVAPHFPQEEGAQAIKFAVQYEHRACKELDRMAVINAIVACIKQPPHKVNLNEPDLTVLVQVMKNTCALSVVRRYKPLGKFNLRELANAGDEVVAPAQKDAAKASSAAIEDKDSTAEEGGAIEEAKDADPKSADND